MGLGNITNVDPGVYAGNKFSAALSILVKHFEQFVSRSTEIFRFFNRMNHRLDSGSVEGVGYHPTVNQEHTPKIYAKSFSDQEDIFAG